MRKKQKWPDELLKATDVLISGVPARSHLNACTGPQVGDMDALEWYADGFRKAARSLVNSLIQNGNTADFPLDVIVYPIVFLYRHHFELMLKLIIRAASGRAKSPTDFPKGHKLVALWQECRPRVEKMFPTANWGQNDFVERLFKELDTVDPVGQAARYPHDTSGKKSFSQQPLLNVEHFAETADRLNAYLDSIMTAIDARRES